MSDYKFPQKAKLFIKSEDASKHFRQFKNDSIFVPQVDVCGKTVHFAGGYLYNDDKTDRCLYLFTKRIYKMSAMELKQFTSINGLVLYLGKIVLEVTSRHLMKTQKVMFDKFILNAMSGFAKNKNLYSLRSKIIESKNRKRDIEKLNRCIECGLFGQTEYIRRDNKSTDKPKVYVHLGLLVAFAIEQLFYLCVKKGYIKKEDHDDYMLWTFRYVPKEVSGYAKEIENFVKLHTRGSPIYLDKFIISELLKDGNVRRNERKYKIEK